LSAQILALEGPQSEAVTHLNSGRSMSVWSKPQAVATDLSASAELTPAVHFQVTQFWLFRLGTLPVCCLSQQYR